MKKIRNFAALYFNLSRKESNGFIVLCGLVLLFIFLPLLTRTVYSSDNITPGLAEQHSLDSMVAILEEPEKSSSYLHKTTKAQNRKTTYSSFDPNSTSEAEMVNAGVQAFIAKRIVKLRSKGVLFKNKEALKKIYGLTETAYQQLYPYIDLPEKIEFIKPFPSSSHPKSIVSSFDLNQADSAQLLSLKGIGPVLACRITKYRKKMGGYIAIEQLQEIYGLDSSVVLELKEKLYITAGFIPEKINLNTTDETLLQSHPYIGKKTGKAILNYRKQHGKFSTLEDMKNIHSISPENFAKMRPYLSVE